MAEIVGVHGIKGFVKLKVFSDNTPRLTAAPLADADGKTFTILSIAPHGNIFLAEVEGIKDRTTAEKLRGTKLYVSRDTLPDIQRKNTYYHADLIGMTAKNMQGTVLGDVINVSNFGAGDLLEVKPVKGNSFYVPFTHSVVPDVSLENKTVTIDPPEGLLD